MDGTNYEDFKNLTLYLVEFYTTAQELFYPHKLFGRKIHKNGGEAIQEQNIHYKFYASP